MRDVKTKNNNNISDNGKNSVLHLNTANLVSKLFFLGVFASAFIYLFFVTSSIFYAINTQKYSYEIDLLNNMAVEVGYNLDSNEPGFSPESFSKKEKITFINRNAETAISLK